MLLHPGDERRSVKLSRSPTPHVGRDTPGGLHLPERHRLLQIERCRRQGFDWRSIPLSRCRETGNLSSGLEIGVQRPARRPSPGVSTLGDHRLLMNRVIQGEHLGCVPVELGRTPSERRNDLSKGGIDPLDISPGTLNAKDDKQASDADKSGDDGPRYARPVPCGPAMPDHAPMLALGTPLDHAATDATSESAWILTTPRTSLVKNRSRTRSKQTAASSTSRDAEGPRPDHLRRGGLLAFIRSDIIEPCQ